MKCVIVFCAVAIMTIQAQPAAVPAPPQPQPPTQQPQQPQGLLGFPNPFCVFRNAADPFVDATSNIPVLGSFWRAGPATVYDNIWNLWGCQRQQPPAPQGTPMQYVPAPQPAAAPAGAVGV